MKKKIIISTIAIIIVLTLIICLLIVIQKKKNEKRVQIVLENMEEINYIRDNSDKITKVMRTVQTEGNRTEMEIDIDKAVNKVINMVIIKPVNIAVTDSDVLYTFEFNDGTEVNIVFEGPYLHYKGVNYEFE